MSYSHFLKRPVPRVVRAKSLAMKYSRICAFFALAFYFMTFGRWNQWYVSSYDDDEVTEQTESAEVLYYLSGAVCLVGVLLVLVDVRSLMRLIRVIGSNLITTLSSIAIILQSRAFRDGEAAQQADKSSLVHERSTGCERLAITALTLASLGSLVLLAEQGLFHHFNFHLRFFSPPLLDPFCNDAWILRPKVFFLSLSKTI